MGPHLAGDPPLSWSSNGYGSRDSKSESEKHMFLSWMVGAAGLVKGTAVGVALALVAKRMIEQQTRRES